MINNITSMEIIDLLTAALARELQVSIQYMLQHTLWSGKKTSSQDQPKKSEARNFIIDHSSVMFPGLSLKKIAITEMKHAERIGEKISFLTGELRPKIPNFELGESLGEILEIDIKQEEIAIQLYTKIIKISKKENNVAMENMFKEILRDEEKHHKKFTELFAKT